MSLDTAHNYHDYYDNLPLLVLWNLKYGMADVSPNENGDAGRDESSQNIFARSVTALKSFERIYS